MGGGGGEEGREGGHIPLPHPTHPKGEASLSLAPPINLVWPITEKLHLQHIW